MRNFLDAFRLRGGREQFEAERFETLDPIARDRSKTIANLVAKLGLTERPKPKSSVDESIKAALDEKDWERAANLLDTKSRRTAADENDLGVALAHVADADEDIWKEATAALARCERAAADATTKALAGRNLAVAKRVTEVLRS